MNFPRSAMWKRDWKVSTKAWTRWHLQFPQPFLPFCFSLSSDRRNLTINRFFIIIPDLNQLSTWTTRPLVWVQRHLLAYLRTTPIQGCATLGKRMGEVASSCPLRSSHVHAQLLSRVWLCNPMDCNPPGSSVHGTFQARTLEWVAISSSRGSSWPRDQTCVSCIVRRILYHWATWEATRSCYYLSWLLSVHLRI